MKTLAHEVALGVLLTLSLQLSSDAEGTAFTYQGRLNDGANLANVKGSVPEL